MSLIATLDVALRADTGQLDKGLDKSAKKVQDFGKNAGKGAAGGKEGGGFMAGIADTVSALSGSASKALAPIAGAATSALGPLSGLAGALAPIAGLATAAIGPLLVVAAAAASAAAAIAALSTGVSSGIAQLSMLSRQAQTLGMTTTALAGLHHAAAMAGLDAETMDHTLVKFARHVSEAAQGTGEGAAVFKQLGLDAKQVADLSPDEQFIQTAGAISKFGSAADKVRVTMALFGREGASMLPTINKGEEAIRALAAETAALGPTNQASIEDIKGIKTAWRSFGEAVAGISRSLAVMFAPTLRAVMEWAAQAGASVAKWVSSNVDFFRELISLTVDFTSALFGLIVELLDFVTGFTVLQDSVGKFLPTWAEFKTMILTALWTLQFGFNQFRDVFVVGFLKLSLSVVQFTNKLAHAFKTEIPAAFEAFVKLMEDVFSGNIDGAIDRFKLKLKDAFSSPAPVTPLERALKDEIDRREKGLKEGLNAFLARKAREFEERVRQRNRPDEAPGKGAKPDPVWQKVAAMEFGSKEAFSVIYGTEDAQKKALNVANDQLAAQRGMRQALERLVRQLRDPVVIRRARV